MTFPVVPNQVLELIAEWIELVCSSQILGRNYITINRSEIKIRNPGVTCSSISVNICSIPIIVVGNTSPYAVLPSDKEETAMNVSSGMNIAGHIGYTSTVIVAMIKKATGSPINFPACMSWKRSAAQD
ncbi:MAG TPA: hypothetical protein V6D10_17575 [Trichocoleus sp.]